MLICASLKELHILVSQGEATLYISGFCLVATHDYYTEGGLDFEAKEC
jgi:hypothetical protein